MTTGADILAAIRSAIAEAGKPVVYYIEYDQLSRGQVLYYDGSDRFNTPPFVICHPDDVAEIRRDVRLIHLRDRQPTPGDYWLRPNQ